VRIAAIADIHCRIHSEELIGQLFHNIGQEADVLVIAGDLTDNGLPEEVATLIEGLQQLTIPILATLGNHDHESGKAEELVDMCTSAGITILNGTAHEIDKVGFVGTKGFCGGFGSCMIQPFGEDVLKTFIRTSIDEAMNLENALAKLTDCQHKFAILHFAPIKETLEGESPELFPFLGSSRLANALDRQGVDVIVHGHAHHGSPFGRTPGDIPVYNVSRFVLNRENGRSYCLIDL
jgi:uncharacterized protein